MADNGCVIGARWGVTDSETQRSYPCDDLVASPVLEAWRGVHVGAPPEAVWPWVAQVRAAPHAYDWIDNLGPSFPQGAAAPPGASGRGQVHHSWRA